MSSNNTTVSSAAAAAVSSATSQQQQTTNVTASTSVNWNTNSQLSNLMPTTPCSFALNGIRKRKVKFTVEFF